MRIARASNHLCHAYLNKQCRVLGIWERLLLKPGGRMFVLFHRRSGALGPIFPTRWRREVHV